MSLYDDIKAGKYDNNKPYESILVDRKIWQEYHDEQSRLYIQFEEDLSEEFGVKENPKRDNLFAKAWDLGHSSGYSEVYLMYEELVDLIR